MNWMLIGVILKVTFGLCAVIFVHELGHFLVAKACGVKCEKFYLFFDIFGYRICRFKWGETEYGIGILPLGGYVKMLGQEDNPARLRAEIEKAKRSSPSQTEGNGSAGDAATEQDPDAASAGNNPADKAGGEQPTEAELKAMTSALYDPRSYLSKSVPQRLAIISAGVVMNVIFAFFMAMVAFGMGVRWVECEVGQVFPGEPAWQVGLQPGDRVVSIAGEPTERFRNLQTAITLGDIDEGVEMVVERPGVGEKTFTVDPSLKRMLATIGVVSPSTTKLREKEHAVLPGSPAARCQPALENGDQIIHLAALVSPDGGDQVVRVDPQPIERNDQIITYLARHPEDKLEVTIRRVKPPEEGADPEAKPDVEEFPVVVAPNPMRRLGLVMEMGPITALQAGSPAAKDGGLQVDDVIQTVDGKPAGDPFTLPDVLRKRAQDPKTRDVTLTVLRGGESVEVPLVLRPVETFTPPEMENGPLAIPALGVAYQVDNRVAEVLPNTPAAKAGIEPGARIVEATLLPPPEEVLEKLDLKQSELDVDISDEKRNWPFMIQATQSALEGSKIKLELEGGKTFEIEPVADAGLFGYNPERGFLFEPKYFLKTATSFGNDVSLAASETVGTVLQVYQFLRKIGTQVSPKAFAGPVTIARVAGKFAYEGTAELLMFLTLLSANLAVVNFLPIPLLDGGHAVLLIAEGIRGKPVSERVQEALTWMGLIFILGLMMWVIGLDIFRLFGWQ